LSKPVKNPSDKENKKEEGILIIISAPSGCGKTTIVDRLLKRHPEWMRSISATTRSPRVGEKSGGDYFFVTEPVFSEMEKNGELLETAKVHEQMYGTPKNYVIDNLDKGKKVILAIDVQGMKKIVKSMGEKYRVITIFVIPPSMKILRERLEGRKTETPEEIERRVSIAQEEIKAAKLYDFTVMNQNLEQTVLDIEDFIEKKAKQRRENSHALRST